MIIHSVLSIFVYTHLVLEVNVVLLNLLVVHPSYLQDVDLAYQVSRIINKNILLLVKFQQQRI